MTCELTRYRVSWTPDGEQKSCVKCLTHGFIAYDGQMGMDEHATLCPAGRIEAEEARTDAQRREAVKAFIDAKRPDEDEVIEAATLEVLSETTMALRNEVTILLARVDAVASALMRMAGKKP